MVQSAFWYVKCYAEEKELLKQIYICVCVRARACGVYNWGARYCRAWKYSPLH